MSRQCLPGRAILIGVALLLALPVGAVPAAEALYPARSGVVFESVDQEGVRAEIERIQFLPEGESLPAEDLRLSGSGRLPRRITSRQAAEDVERVFRLLREGWCAWGFFQERGDLDAARRSILQGVEARPEWKPRDLRRLIIEHLGFVQDCHLNLGGRPFCAHEDFWHDASLEISRDGLRFPCGEATCTLEAVNGTDPLSFLYPSLNEAGEAVFRLGVLSATEPLPLRLTARDGDRERRMEVGLRRSEFHPRKTFAEERIGGIPVVRARSFADFHGDEMRAFLETAGRYRGEPYLVLDIRGNGGGNTRWPREWIERFTGRRPALKQVLTEMVTPASMAGRANIFESMLRSYPEKEKAWVESELDGYLRELSGLADGTIEPHWTPWVFPDTTPIPNPTTLIVVMDGRVASSGEGLVSYLFGQVENVVFVGENTRGALTFGQTSLHRLPHSHLRFIVPIKLNVPLDLEFREGRGYLPDLWLPAPHALNCAVAAARKGTIGTAVDLPGDYFEAEFVPEKVRGRPWPGRRGKVALIAGSIGLIIFLAGNLVRIVLRRRKAGR